jgi:hypothetical protein
MHLVRTVVLVRWITTPGKRYNVMTSTGDTMLKGMWKYGLSVMDVRRHTGASGKERCEDTLREYTS